MLRAKSSIKFPEGVTAESFWQTCFDTAFNDLNEKSQTVIAREMQ